MASGSAAVMARKTAAPACDKYDGSLKHKRLGHLFDHEENITKLIIKF